MVHINFDTRDNIDMWKLRNEVDSVGLCFLENYILQSSSSLCTVLFALMGLSKVQEKTTVAMAKTTDYQISYNQRETFLRDNVHRLKILRFYGTKGKIDVIW